MIYLLLIPSFIIGFMIGYMKGLDRSNNKLMKAERSVQETLLKISQLRKYDN